MTNPHCPHNNIEIKLGKYKRCQDCGEEDLKSIKIIGCRV